MMPMKKPGMSVTIEAGKGMPPKPPMGMEDAPKMPGMDDEPDGDEGAEDPMMSMIHELTMKIDKICQALGCDDMGDSGGSMTQPDMGEDMGADGQ